MLLEGKTAVIYGGAGAIGSAVARAFAREGATVFLAGRTEVRLAAIARDIQGSGGNVEIATVDALDADAVDAHADAIAAQTGHLDISFNLISHNDVQGTPLVEMDYTDFERPVVTALKTTFLTARAAARHMIKQGSGVILMFGGYGDPAREFNLGGLQVAFQALDTLRNQLATELGSYGIRVATLQTGGVTETLPPDFEGREQIVESIERATLLNRAATFADVGNVAAFAASDWARAITATAINITAGSEID